ncbi:MAG: polysaccharide pyruvyl transferase family protein [Pseudomonadota bacterium]
MQTRAITIGLLWHSMNSDNLGVGALSVAHIGMLREAAAALDLKPRFVVLCWDDPGAPYGLADDIEIVALRLRDFARPRGLWAQARRCDIVFDIGAGDSFADIYGPARIVKMLVAQNIVLLSGRSLVFSPQTIGPFQRSWLRILARNLMQRARMVAVRDAQSARFAREMGFTGELTEATDVALRLPYERSDESSDERRAFRIGINVSGLLFNGGYTGGNMFGLADDYAQTMRRIVGHFHGLPGYEVHLISHVQSDQQPVEDDRSAARELAREYPGCIIAPTFSGPSEAKAYISDMDFFTGARMHACIAAFSAGVPVLPLAYSKKFAGLFGTLGYPHWADCRTDSTDEILERLKEAVINRASLRADLTTARAEGLRRLDIYAERVRACLAGALKPL